MQKNNRNEILENEYLEIRVNYFGAELSSLIKKSTSVEYLWQADSAHWGRHAPILFPIVGRLKADQYLIGKKFYQMKQHGLARNMEFQLVKKTAVSLIFELNSTEETLQNYPFPFRLRINYTLRAHQLIISYQVLNLSEDDLLFSIGAHPAFRCPLKEAERRSDYQLVFEKQEMAFTSLLKAGLRTGRSDLILKDQRNLPISDHLFDKDALVFKALKSNWVCLQRGEEKILTFDFTGFPYLGIWSKSAIAPFVCIEPWFGVADDTKHNQQFSQKEAIIKLAAQNNFDCTYSIEIH